MKRQHKGSCRKTYIITANPFFNIHISKEIDSGVLQNHILSPNLCKVFLRLVTLSCQVAGILNPPTTTLHDFFSRSDQEVVVLWQLWGNVLEVIIMIEKTNTMTNTWRNTKTKTDKCFFCGIHATSPNSCYLTAASCRRGPERVNLP